MHSGANAHNLVILGDGVLRGELTSLINKLDLQSVVHLPGFKQYDELPYYYAFASVFIHASTTEQWGLVVNEAMAAGLPVIVSERCGCVPELVKNSFNGFTFNPFVSSELTEKMQAVTSSKYDLKQMGRNSTEIISEWQPDHFGKGLKRAVESAFTEPRKKGSLTDNLLLKYLIQR